MKLNEILKEIKKLRDEIGKKRIVVRLDNESQSYEDWLKQHGVNDNDVIVVNIWIPST